jgi:crotonobetainyl-CoA:carnitine CoA-transferase CaiB-like acyl-CoA transferase
VVVELDQPGGLEPVRRLGAPVRLSRTPPDTGRLPGRALGEHTGAVLRAACYDDAPIVELLRSGAVAGPHSGAGGSFLG